jgi:hypothetical protein
VDGNDGDLAFVERRVNRIGAAVVITLALASGCARDAPQRRQPQPQPTFEDLIGSPQAYDGRRVRVEAAYYGAFEVSVLTSGFRESFPPQPIDPLVWVGAAPPDRCLETEERVAWSDRVVAEGTFRYQADRGLGHLGGYDMAIEDATLTCD